MMFARQERLITELDNGNVEPAKSVACAIRDRLKMIENKALTDKIGVQETATLTTNSAADLDTDKILLWELPPPWVESTAIAAPELSVQPIQEWEGYVTQVGEKTFRARLVDLTTNQNVEEEWAEFETNELSDANSALLREGAVFRWVIGFQRAPSGTKRRVSDIVFRRLPAWTKKELAEAQNRATSLVKDSVWD